MKLTDEIDRLYTNRERVKVRVEVRVKVRVNERASQKNIQSTETYKN